jgi:hypothetical protein
MESEASNEKRRNITDSRSKIIDTFQIVGFISTGVMIALVIAQIDPLQSTIIGLMLAILTQLFDLQLRHSNSEERVLQANALSQSLYRDSELLTKVRQIVQDYYTIKDGWFDLFKARADDAVSECHSILHSVAGGAMESRSPYTLSVTGFKFAQETMKQVTDFAAIKDAVEGVRGWYMKSWTEVAKRGVRMTMVLILSREEFKDMLARAHTTNMAVGMFIALKDELPMELDENYVIVDDRVVGFSERRADGTLNERNISTIPVEVERMFKRFDQVLRYARTAEDVLAEASNPIAEVRSGVAENT